MGKKKDKGPKRKRIIFDVNADIDQTRFLKVYEVQCAKNKSVQCSWIVKALKKGIDIRTYTKTFVVEPAPESCPPEFQITLDPIVDTIRKAHYLYLNELYVWDLELKHTTIASIALLIEKGIYPLHILELMDCDILDYSMTRLARSFKVSNLTDINFDYNEFGDEGCIGLCHGCKHNKTIISISLCYCALTSISGTHLGDVAYNSAIREFYLDGNKLEAVGVMEMLRQVSIAAEDENVRRIEAERLKAIMIVEGALEASDKNLPSQMATDASGVETDGGEGKPKKKKKKKGKKKKKKEADPPLVGPYIYKLHLADNGIDSFGEGREDNLFLCIGTIVRMIMYSNCLCELDLEDNPVGNLAAREIMVALERRKEGNLPPLNMKTTAEIQKDIFAAIGKLCSGLKKKKKKGKKKNKK